jgi:hypothetical protein
MHICVHVCAGLRLVGSPLDADHGAPRAMGQQKALMPHEVQRMRHMVCAYVLTIL